MLLHYTRRRITLQSHPRLSFIYNCSIKCCFAASGEESHGMGVHSFGGHSFNKARCFIEQLTPTTVETNDIQVEFCFAPDHTIVPDFLSNEAAELSVPTPSTLHNAELQESIFIEFSQSRFELGRRLLEGTIEPSLPPFRIRKRPIAIFAKDTHEPGRIVRIV